MKELIAGLDVLAGQFYSQDSYLFVARYLLPSEDENLDNSEQEDEIKDSDTERIVYFWQGRNANNTAWLFFNYTYVIPSIAEGESETNLLIFSFKQELIDVLGDFEIVQLIQQQENQRFMAHFNRKFIIHNGKRRTAAQRVQMPQLRLTQTQMYHIRWCYSTIMTRSIQTEATSANLCSEFPSVMMTCLSEHILNGNIFSLLVTSSPSHWIQETLLASSMFGSVIRFIQMMLFSLKRSPTICSM